MQCIVPNEYPHTSYGRDKQHTHNKLNGPLRSCTVALVLLPRVDTDDDGRNFRKIDLSLFPLSARRDNCRWCFLPEEESNWVVSSFLLVHQQPRSPPSRERHTHKPQKTPLLLLLLLLFACWLCEPLPPCRAGRQNDRSRNPVLPDVGRVPKRQPERSAASTQRASDHGAVC